MSSRVALVLAFGLGLTVFGCATLMRIPGTTVLDNPANRELIKLCERYRLAMEERDSGTLLALGIAWPTLVGSLAWAAALGRFRRGDAV